MTSRRGTVRREVRIDRPADLVWGIVGDAERLAEWFPGIGECTVEGDVRTIVMGSGLALPEQILTVDPLLRRFQYRITAPMLIEHTSTIDVLALDETTSLVVYSADANPSTMALIIGGAAGNALVELKRLLEHDLLTPSTSVPRRRFERALAPAGAPGPADAAATGAATEGAD